VRRVHLSRSPRIGATDRRGDTSTAFHDVTKTKPSHHQRPETAATLKGPKGPTTSEGAELASEVAASTLLADDAKARLLAEIINHESTHGRCTHTFIKKVRKQARGPGPG